MKRAIAILMIAALAGCGLLIPDPEPEPSPTPPTPPTPPPALVELVGEMHLAFLDNFNEGLILSPPQWLLPSLGAYEYTNADGTFSVSALLDKPEDDQIRYTGAATFTGYPVLGCTFSGEQAVVQIGFDSGKVKHDSHIYADLTDGCGFIDVYLSIHWQYTDSDGFYGAYGVVEADGIEYALIDFGLFN